MTKPKLKISLLFKIFVAFFRREVILKLQSKTNSKYSLPVLFYQYIACPLTHHNVTSDDTLPIRIREVHSSNLGPETKYSDRIFVISSVRPGKCRGSTLKLGHYHFLSNPFQLIIHLPLFHSTS
jgi:hypothetical protein